MSLESESHSTRLDFLQKRVSTYKQYLKYYEELVTREVCLQNGQHYEITKQSKPAGEEVQLLED